MKHTHTKREKGQALFLAALMVLSVFAMSASFAGMAAADDHTISGTVTEADGTTAIEGATVTAEGDNETEATATTDVDGNYTLDVNSEENYTVTAVAEGFVLETEEVASGDFEGTPLEATQNFQLVEPPATNFADQTSDGTTVTVDNVNMTKDGFVAIHDDTLFDDEGNLNDPFGSVIGVSDNLTVGDQGSVEITLFEDVPGTDFDGQESLEGGDQTLYAMPHVDSNNDQTYDFITSGGAEDGPFLAQEDGEVGIAGMTSATVTAYDHDAIAEENSTYWQGQDLFYQNDSASGDETYQLRTDDGDDTTRGDLVTEFTLDEDGAAVISTSGLDGTYKIVSESGDDDLTGLEVAEQNLDAEFNPNEVTDAGEDSETELELGSNRGSYWVEVTDDDLSADDLADIFGDSVEEQTEDGVILASSDTSADFGGQDIGDYNLTVEVTDTDANAMASITVMELGEGEASFPENIVEEERGDIAEVTIDLENTDTADIQIGDDSVGYNVSATVHDNDGDGEVTLHINTYNPSEDAHVWAEGDDDVSNVGVNNAPSNPLDAGDYELIVSIGGEEQDIATLVLNERSTDAATTYIAPAGTDLSDLDAVKEADEEGHLTENDDVAHGDIAVIQVEASGIFGLLEAEDNAFENELLAIAIEETNPGPNQDAMMFDHSDVSWVEDPDNNQLFIVVDTNDLTDTDVDDEFEVSFAVNEDSNLVDDDNESVETEFAIVEYEAEFDTNDDGVVEVEQSAEATLTGWTSAAPGTDLDIRSRASGDNPFLMSQTVTVESDQTWTATFDFEDIEVGTEFSSEIRNVDEQVDSIVVESTYEQDPHTVTITVEDEDGNAVEGADVEVSNGDTWTETTDANGEVTFELAHGEYDVTASHDGEEASGTLTVDDDTSDSGTLILGQEDQQIPEGDGDGDGDGSGDGDGDGSGDGDGDGEDPGDGSDGDGDDDDDDTEDQPGFGIAVALIALLAAAGFALRNRA